MQVEDDVILSDAERLRTTQSNVKMVLSLSLSLPFAQMGCIFWFVMFYFTYVHCSFKGIFKLTLFLGSKE